MPGTGICLILMQYCNKNKNFFILYLKKEIKGAVSGENPPFKTVFYFPSVLNKAQGHREFCREVTPALTW